MTSEYQHPLKANMDLVDDLEKTMFTDVDETTMKFHRACINADLMTISNILRIDQERINVKQLDMMGTLPKTLSLIRNIFSTIEEAIEKDPRVKIVKMLFEIGVAWPKELLDGFLFMAASSKDVKIVEKLLKLGANVNIQNDKMQTPLHLACNSENDTADYEIVKLLLEKGAIVNAKDCDGNTPLYVAHWPDIPEIVEELLKHGADFDSENGALYFAIEFEYVDELRMILENGCSTNVRRSAFEFALSMKSLVQPMDIVKMMAFHDK